MSNDQLHQAKAYYEQNRTNTIPWSELSLTMQGRWISHWKQADLTVSDHVRLKPEDLLIVPDVDMVAHPPHYELNGPPCAGCGRPIQCIEVREDMTANLSDAVKYIWRNGEKAGADQVEDLRKAVWYIDREIARLGRGV